MRTLILNKFLHRNGGSETYIFKLGEALEQHGHEVQYFGMEHEGRCVGNRVNAYTSDMDFHGGSKLSKLTYPIKTIYSKEARVQLRKVLDDFKPDVCHLNNFNYQLTPSIILEIVKWRKETGRDCKIIFTAHDYQLVCPNHMLNNPNTHQNCEKCLGGHFVNCMKGKCIHGSTAKSAIGMMEAEFWKTPFIVINADDYYGKEGFKAVHEYLVNGGKSCMAGFVLKNTLSDNGGVTRGICKMDEQNNLTEVVETKNIVKTATGAEADGMAVDVNSLVSMNMWGLTPDFLDVLEEGFKEFFEKEVPGNPLKAEYLIPIFIGELLEQGKMSVKVLKTNDTWYGMTYHEDVAAVKGSFKEMLENGVYKADLFSDL